MNQFFGNWVDLVALLLAVLLPLVFIFSIKRKTGKQTRAVAMYLLLFGPLGILTFTFFHLFENSYHAIRAIQAGSFHYDFHFYSLFLMGVVFARIGHIFLRNCLQKCLVQDNDNRPVLKSILLIVVVSIPLLPISAISIIPIICCAISLAGLPFLRRKKKTIPISSTTKETTGLLTTTGHIVAYHLHPVDLWV